MTYLGEVFCFVFCFVFLFVCFALFNNLSCLVFSGTSWIYSLVSAINFGKFFSHYYFNYSFYFFIPSFLLTFLPSFVFLVLLLHPCYIFYNCLTFLRYPVSFFFFHFFKFPFWKCLLTYHQDLWIYPLLSSLLMKSLKAFFSTFISSFLFIPSLVFHLSP